MKSDEILKLLDCLKSNPSLSCVLGIVDAENKGSCKVVENQDSFFVEANECKSGGFRQIYRKDVNLRDVLFKWLSVLVSMVFLINIIDKELV